MSNKYKKLIIFIGEGKSEMSFIMSLLKNKYGYSQSLKSNAFLEKGNKLFCLAHPKMGVCHKGGDCTIYGEETYRKIKGLLLTTCRFVFNLGIDIKYLIMTDVKESSKKNKFSQKYIDKHLVHFPGDIIIPFAKDEIETWFLAGIGEDFKLNYDIDQKELDLFLKNKDIDSKRNTKEILDGILPRQLSGKTMYIGEEFGRYIDIKLGITNSKSFKNFIKNLEDII